jgi:hypothetical protein
MLRKDRVLFRIEVAGTLLPKIPAVSLFGACADSWEKLGARRLFPTLALLLAGFAGAICSAHGGDAYRLLRLDGREVKWGSAAMGSGASLTYEVLYAPSPLAGSHNCRKLAGIGSLLVRSRITQHAFEHELSEAFSLWEAVANVRFRRVASVSSADIVISAEAIPDGVAYADVTLASSSGGVVAPIAKGIVCLNPDVYWTAGKPGRAILPNANFGVYELRYTLAHEIGHVLGLDHPGPTGELMSFAYDEDIDRLQPGDIAGIVALYGPRSSAPHLTLNEKRIAAR